MDGGGGDDTDSSEGEIVFVTYDSSSNQLKQSKSSSSVDSGVYTTSTLSLLLNPSILANLPNPSKQPSEAASSRNDAVGLRRRWNHSINNLRKGHSGFDRKLNGSRSLSSDSVFQPPSDDILTGKACGRPCSPAGQSNSRYVRQRNLYRPPLASYSSLSSLDKESVWGLHWFGETWEGDMTTMLYCG